MQLTREELVRACRTMRVIRDVEERPHIEFSPGEIPGFVQLSAREAASAVGVCIYLPDADLRHAPSTLRRNRSFASHGESR
jgi:acetoin:2,6-dichlorophenolindophenol oxidoreductase subunit alpha